MLVEIACYSFMGLTGLATILLLLTRHLLYAAFFLLLALLGIAGLFVFAGADFLAVAQIMVYVGGVLVLLLFGIMYTRKQEGKQPMPLPFSYPLAGGLICGTLLFLLLKAIFSLSLPPLPALAEASTVKPLGVSFMTDMLLPFEVAGLLLLAALIGAAGIAIRKN